VLKNKGTWDVDAVGRSEKGFLKGRTAKKCPRSQDENPEEFRMPEGIKKGNPCSTTKEGNITVCFGEKCGGNVLDVVLRTRVCNKVERRSF